MLIREIVDQALNEVLMGTYRGHYNSLDGSLDAVVTLIPVNSSLRAIGEQAIMEIDQELMYVVPGGVDTGGPSLTVIRGFMGTTAATHADGAQITINPRYPRSTILSAIKEDARSWPDQFYVVLSDDVEVLDSVVDLQASFTRDDILSVVKVLRQWSQSGVSSDRWMRVRDWRFEKDTDGPGSADLFVHASCTGSNLRVQVAVPMEDVDAWDEATDLADIGLPTSMADVLKYGACWRLVTGRETRRLFTEAEAESRLAADVPATSLLTLGRAMKQLRDQRLNEEIFRLTSRYGLSRI